MVKGKNGRLIPTLGLCLLAAGSGGCGRATGYERYIPAASTARAAVEAALQAWQEGLPPAGIGTSPRIQVVDSHRRPGQTLRDFEVLGEVKGRDGPRCFAVRLTLENPSEQQKVRFCAIGIDPLWVFREEEYEMMMHWECFSPKEKIAAKVPPSNVGE